MNQKNRELICFCQLLATSLKSGRPLPVTLSQIKETNRHSRAVEWCHRIGKRLSEGVALETAVKELAGFDPVLASLMPLLGENRLIQVLEAYTRYIVVVDTLNFKLSTALAYPFMLLLFICFNLLHLNFKLFPGALEQMRLAKQPANLVMRMLYFAEVSFWPWSLIVPLTVFVAIFLIIKQFLVGIRSGKTFWGRFSGMNDIVKQQNAARAQSVIGLYLEAGYSLDKALRISSNIFDGHDCGLGHAATALERGVTIEEAFSKSEVLDSLIISDDSSEGLILTMKRFATGNYNSSLARLKTFSAVFGTLAMVVAGFFVLSVTSGFFDTYYWLIWSY